MWLDPDLHLSRRTQPRPTEMVVEQSSKPPSQRDDEAGP